ncbi:MAG: DUF456 domain-containing protein [Candidatus Auribacter fodinae]|uniref:DUF456 domain-containing protein n=1 Tax=Candidatus Auribacter fodinae TaxID=2093366 RepID=A0A3A4RJT0_9BACT|nr:MAG: DUF456 domain-containing protein [Candidatus Auribacter fodinae]
MNMSIVLWSIVVICIVIGILGVVLPALPGIPLAFAGFLIAAWMDSFQKVGALTVIVLAVLTVISVVLDFLVTALGAKRMGASWLAMAGAGVGTVVGLFFGIMGLVFGPFIGAVAGELLAKKKLMQAGRVGVGTWIGIIVGTAVKLAIMFAMTALFVAAYFY